MRLSRWKYYLTSIPTLLLGIRNSWVILAALLKLRPFYIVHLRDGSRFKVRTLMDIWIIKETCLDRDYETHGVLLQDGWIVMDIGAALGDFAVATARQHPHSQVYAYEPFPESYQFLQENMALNGVSNVKTFPYAIGAAEGALTLEVGTGVAVKHSTAQTQSEQGIQVKSYSLDQVMESIPHCDFLKMDCEGGEYNILMHASPATLGKIKHICLEYHEGVTRYTHTDLAQFLQQRGFTVKTTPNPAHQEIGFLYARNVT